MTPARSKLPATVETYLTRNPGEREALEDLLNALGGAGDPFSRATLPRHVTCSAVVIDRDRRVLHIRHKATGKLLAPGGHVEDDRTLLAAALREVHEETGIPPEALCLTAQFLDAPIDIDVHDIDANLAKGEPAHQHVDFRFAFYLTAEQPPELALQETEVSGAQWLPFADVRSPTLRAKLVSAQAQGLNGRPEPVNASVLIHDGHGRYLLHLRDDLDGIWEPWTIALLGGGREPGDASLEAALHRELAEEAPGIEPTELAPYDLAEARSVDGLTVPVQVFSGRWGGDPDTVDLREGVLLRWFTPDALDMLRLSPGLGDLIRRHAAEHPPAGSPSPVNDRLLPGEAPAGTELHIVGVHLYLEDEHGRILLGLRHPDSAFAPSQWHVLAGHCEREEAIACLVREAREEAGLIIEPGEVELVHLVHLVDSPSARPRIGLFFRARTWSGTPSVLEPDKCVQWQWWDPQDLPDEVVPYTRQVIDGILAGHRYSQTGWKDTQDTTTAGRATGRGTRLAKTALPPQVAGAAAARAAMVARLKETGALGPGAVRDALLVLSREVLMPQAYVRRSAPGEEPPRWDLLDWAAPQDRTELLERLHGGASVLIQHDGEPLLGRARGARSGASITSMSTVMELTAQLLDQLDLRAGQRVLDVGTGAGVTAAVACHICGDQQVVTLDRDRHLAEAAAARLAELGFRPEVLCGPGEKGAPGWEFDRIFVSYTAQRVPGALVEQLAPGGRLLMNVSTASPSWPALAVVERTADGQLVGQLRAVECAHRAGHGVERIWLDDQFRQRIATEPGTRTRWSALPPPADSDRGLWLAVEGAVGGLVRNSRAEHCEIGAPGCGSWLRVQPAGKSGWEVTTRGPRDIWTEIQKVAEVWRAAGSPGHYRLLFEPDGGQRAASACGRLSWRLPAPCPPEEADA